MPRLSPAAALALAFAACATPPPPTQAAQRLAQNPRDRRRGTRDRRSRAAPVAGVARAGDAAAARTSSGPPPAPTDADGRFRLSLDAPAEYVFLDLRGPRGRRHDVAARSRARADRRQPGETRQGVALTLLGEEREKLIAPGE